MIPFCLGLTQKYPLVWQSHVTASQAEVWRSRKVARDLGDGLRLRRLFRISWENEGAESLGWRVGDETFQRLRSSVQNLGLPETQSNDNSKLTPKVSKDQDDG